MKFTLLSNDKLQFKIKQRWDFSAPEVLIINSYCYRQIKYIIASININKPTPTTSWDRIMFLRTYKKQLEQNLNETNNKNKSKLLE